MTDRPWMKLYIGDYRSDTGHLSAAQHGAYLLLIMHYWKQGRLPGEDEQLARIAAMTPDEWKQNRETIQEFFDDDWRHGRIDREIDAFDTSVKRRSKAGKLGGRPPKKPTRSVSNQRINNDNTLENQSFSKSKASQSQRLDSDSEVRFRDQIQTESTIEEEDSTEIEREKKGPFKVVKGGQS